MCYEEESVALRTPNGRVVRLTQPRRALADGVEHALNVGRGARDGVENLAGRRILLSRLSKVLLRHGEFSGSLVKLYLEVGCGGTATARSRCVLAALDLRCLPAARFHRPAARRCTGLTSGLGTNAIDVTNGQPLIKPSRAALRTKPGAVKGITRPRH
jgi:hypothetical protein